MSTQRGNLGKREQTKAPESWGVPEQPPEPSPGAGEPDRVTVLTVAIGHGYFTLPVIDSVEEAVRKVMAAGPRLIGFERPDMPGQLGFVRGDYVIMVDSKLLLPDNPYEEVQGYEVPDDGELFGNG